MIALSHEGVLHTHKLLSSDPERYDDAITQGVINILQQNQATLQDLSTVKIGTTVGTNALLEHKGEPVLLVTTRGFRDAFRIAYQERPDLFALNIQLPHMLYAAVMEVDERVGPRGKCYQALDVNEARKAMQAHYDKGYRAVAVVLMHAYKYPEHEQQLGKIAQDIGFEYISLSSGVSS